jgi:hypothetical protein
MVVPNVVVKYKIGVVIRVDVARASVARPFKLNSKLKRSLNIKSKKKEYLTALDYFDQV